MAVKDIMARGVGPSKSNFIVTHGLGGEPDNVIRSVIELQIPVDFQLVEVGEVMFTGSFEVVRVE